MFITMLVSSHTLHTLHTLNTLNTHLTHFTHMHLSFYSSCGVLPPQDDPTEESYNVPARVDAFVATAMDQAKHYTTNNIMMTFGDDFQYENARQNFKNIDKLIKYVNQV